MILNNTPLDPTNEETTVDTLTNLSQNRSSSESSVLKSFNPESSNHSTSESGSSSSSRSSMAKSNVKLLAMLSLVAIVAGVGTGYGGFKLQTKAAGGSGGIGGGGEIQQVAEGSVKAGDVFGVEDTETFKDNAEGYLEIGGLDGEGSHKLLRPGGESQTVYLTSSVTDLDKFDGMEVKIWGETFKGQKAGWLMDVGRVEIVNPKGSAPETEE